MNETTGKPKQRVLIRAWKKCTTRAYSTHDDGFIHKHEFRAFVRYIMFFNDLSDVFTEIDDEGSEDKRLSKEEFVAGGALLFGEQVTAEELEKTFANMDANGGGIILFDEFCHYCCSVLDA